MSLASTSSNASSEDLSLVRISYQESDENQKKSEELESSRKNLDQILWTILCEAIRESDTEFDGSQINLLHSRLFDSIWIEIQGQYINISPEKKLKRSKAILCTFCQKVDVKKAEVLNLLSVNPSVLQLFINCFMEIAFKPRGRPFGILRWGRMITRLFILDVPPKTAFKEESCKMVIDLLLRKVIKIAVSKSGSTISPNKFEEIHFWLLTHVWEDFEGRDFEISPDKLKKMAKAVLNLFCDISRAPPKKVLDLLKLRHEKVALWLVAAFKHRMMLAERENEISQMDLPSINKAIKILSHRGKVGSKVFTEEQAVSSCSQQKVNRAEMVYQDLLNMILKEVLTRLNSNSNHSVSLNQLEDFTTWLFMKIWAEVWGHHLFFSEDNYHRFIETILQKFSEKCRVSKEPPAISSLENPLNISWLIEAFKETLVEPNRHYGCWAFL